MTRARRRAASPTTRSSAGWTRRRSIPRPYCSSRRTMANGIRAAVPNCYSLARVEVAFTPSALRMVRCSKSPRHDSAPSDGIREAGARSKAVVEVPAKTVMKSVTRCPWPTKELDIHYHDTEWGVPQHDDRLLFEFLILEGAQAGLSWSTILNKRENYRAALDQFDASRIAKYDERKVAKLLADPGIVRNKLKVAATIQNAKSFLAVKKEFGSLDAYLWQFVGGKPKQNAWISMKQVPARTTESDAMSKDLLKRGFKFVGSTICYALMQAVGMVNDHTVDCFRYKQVAKLR